MHSRTCVFFAFAAFTLLAACGDDSSTSPAPTPSAVGMHDITITAPNGGEAFKAGDSISVKWSANEDSLNSASIAINCGSSATWSALTSTSVTPDMSSWGNLRAQIPATLSGSCRIKISDYQMTWNYDTTDARFTVTAP